MIHSLTKKHPSLQKHFLRINKYLTTHGIPSPFTASGRKNEKTWLNQTKGNRSRDPNLYTELDHSSELLFEEILPLIPKDAAILEIGCNAGRHLDYLYKRGYTNLTGIEIGAEAVELMKEKFPETYKGSNVIVGSAPPELKKLASEAYDFVFCHSVLVQIGPEYNYIFREIARVNRGYIVTLENEESVTSFVRDFEKMFANVGCRMIDFRYYIQDSDGKTLRKPRPQDAGIKASASGGLYLRTFVKC